MDPAGKLRIGSKIASEVGSWLLATSCKGSKLACQHHLASSLLHHLQLTNMLNCSQSGCCYAVVKAIA